MRVEASWERGSRVRREWYRPGDLTMATENLFLTKLSAAMFESSCSHPTNAVLTAVRWLSSSCA